MHTKQYTFTPRSEGIVFVIIIITLIYSLVLYIVLPSMTNALPAHVTAHRINDPANDQRRPILFIPTQANVRPGISTRQTRTKFKYLFPLKLVEFNERP